MRRNVNSEWFPACVWRETMKISFTELSLSLVNASQTQVGKLYSETNSIMPPLLTARPRVSFFAGFSTTRKLQIFKKILGNSGKFSESRKSSRFPGNFCGIQEISRQIFELDYYDIFSDFQHFRFNF